MDADIEHATYIWDTSEPYAKIFKSDSFFFKENSKRTEIYIYLLIEKNGWVIMNIKTAGKIVKNGS